MKFVIIFLFTFISVFASAEDSKLVDVDKNSKLSSYFQKINKKVTDSSEDKPLAEVKDKSDVTDQALDEEDILLKEAGHKNEQSASMSPFQKMMMAVVALLFMAGSFIMAVRKMGKGKGYSNIAKNITVLTQKSIGPKKNLMLIRIAGETILLGVTDHNINHIKTLSLMEDEIPDYTEPQFSNQLKDKISKAQDEPSIIERQPEEVDGFAISRLDDVKQAVSRYSL